MSSEIKAVLFLPSLTCPPSLSEIKIWTSDPNSLKTSEGNGDAISGPAHSLRSLGSSPPLVGKEEQRREKEEEERESFRRFFLRRVHLEGVARRRRRSIGAAISPPFPLLRKFIRQKRAEWGIEEEKEGNSFESILISESKESKRERERDATGKRSEPRLLGGKAPHVKRVGGRAQSSVISPISAQSVMKL